MAGLHSDPYEARSPLLRLGVRTLALIGGAGIEDLAMFGSADLEPKAAAPAAPRTGENAIYSAFLASRRVLGNVPPV